LSQPLPATAQELGLVACHGCKLVCDAPAIRCPRCGARLHYRKPASMSRTLALLCAAVMLYLPANLLPVMRSSQFGQASENTIIGGVLAFWHAGEFGIALVIFLASVAIPCAKFLTLGWLLWCVHRGHQIGRRQRTQLYRAIEFIGYWSMLDVLVVGLVCALVRFNLLGSVEPRSGIVFFGVVVILTMLSASSFDPRLIWDDPKHD